MAKDKWSLAKVPRTVWMLGFVSLFMDLSSELVHSLLPVFLVNTLGTSVLTVGIIEGVAEAATPIVKVFSGAISDYFRHRKLLILLGYGMAALTKPLFPLANSAMSVFVARILDRIGKGIRGAPRDALVADVAPPGIRGACFGLRQSMDTLGAVAGPLLAMILMYCLANDIKQALWFAVGPAFISVVLIVFGVIEPEAPRVERQIKSPNYRDVLRRFPSSYWRILIAGGLFALARFSEAFLVLRASEAGFELTWVPLVMVVMSLVYTFSALPSGMLSDRMHRQSVLALGLVFLVLGDIVMAVAWTPLPILVGVGLWGLHLGFSQGVFGALVADVAPEELRGTAFGIFNLVFGLCMLLANVIAGFVWEYYGAQITFYIGMGFALIALIVVIFPYEMKGYSSNSA